MSARKAYLIFTMVVTAVTLPNSVWALVNLKQVQVSKGDHIDLLFDRKVNPKNVKIDYFRDIIQLTLKGVSVYPAKIFSVNGDSVRKVFAYQYSPKLVRFRVTVTGQAERYKGRIKLNHSGKMIALHVAPHLDQIQSSQAQRTKLKSAESDKMIQQVLSTQEQKSKNQKKQKSPSPSKSKNEESLSSMGSAIASPNPLGAFWWLLVIMGGFGVFALILKKLKASGSIKLFGKKIDLSKAMGRDGSLGRFRVLSTHSIGQKKSIVTAEIAGRTLVLGVTQHSINFLCELPGKSEEAPIQNSSNEPTVNSESELFSQALSELSGEPAAIPTSMDRSQVTRASDRIRDRLKGMKSLSRP